MENTDHSKNMESILVEGKKYLELFANKKGEVQCPYCNQVHTHSIVNGYRSANCNLESHIISPIFLDNNQHNQEDGYFIRFASSTGFLLRYVLSHTSQKVFASEQISVLTEIIDHNDLIPLEKANQICEFLDIPKRGNRSAIKEML
jgi:uncharacterized Zn finger protein (UPF0148 family)